MRKRLCSIGLMCCVAVAQGAVWVEREWQVFEEVETTFPGPGSAPMYLWKVERDGRYGGGIAIIDIGRSGHDRCSKADWDAGLRRFFELSDKTILDNVVRCNSSQVPAARAYMRERAPAVIGKKLTLVYTVEEVDAKLADLERRLANEPGGH